jgi:aryl-alcohol dehydrogenase-like predicted oxidoreductase
MPETTTATAAGSLDLGGDLTVQRMGFGAMRLTGPGIWGEPANPDECKAVLRRALELGVDFIDTADSYGPEVSERLIAEALHPYPDNLVIATKAGMVRPGPGRWDPEGRPEHLRQACEGSLRRLRLEQIPLLQLHRPDPRVRLEDSVGALVQLKDEGKVRHIGLSNVTEAELHRAMAVTPVVSVQNMFNVGSRRSTAVLDVCETEQLTFIPWAPIGQGAPSGKALSRIAAAHGATQQQVALAWLLARSPVMLPIAGTASPAHLEENVAAASLRLGQAEVDELGL